MSKNFACISTREYRFSASYHYPGPYRYSRSVCGRRSDLQLPNTLFWWWAGYMDFFMQGSTTFLRSGISHNTNVYVWTLIERKEKTITLQILQNILYNDSWYQKERFDTTHALAHTHAHTHALLIVILSYSFGLCTDLPFWGELRPEYMNRDVIKWNEMAWSFLYKTSCLVNDPCQLSTLWMATGHQSVRGFFLMQLKQK